MVKGVWGPKHVNYEGWTRNLLRGPVWGPSVVNYRVWTPNQSWKMIFREEKRVRGPEVRGSGVQVRGPRFLEVVFYFPLLHFIMFQWGKDPKPGQIRRWPLVSGPGALG